MSYTQTSYHIVLRTHRSIPAIVEDHERELYSYILGVINNKIPLYTFTIPSMGTVLSISPMRVSEAWRLTPV